MRVVYPEFARSLKCAMVVMFLLFAILVAVAPMQAHITKIVIDKSRSESPAYGGKSYGNVGQYEKLYGEAYGELDPKDPHNSSIQDIQLAPRNSRGMVEYVTDFSISKPIDISKASGVMIYDTVNRGNEVVPNTYRSGDSTGDDFLAARGAIIVRSGWQGDLVAGGGGRGGRGGARPYTIQVPIAKNPDGSSVTSLVIARFIDMPPNATTLALTETLPMSGLTYEKTASLDTTQAKLTTHASETLTGVITGDKSIPSTDWAWADCTKVPFPGTPDPAKICLKNGFDPKLLYQLIFTAKDPMVTGVGLAAIRDVVSFFRHSEKDEEGTPNPVAGKVSTVIGHGTSQTGRVVRTVIALGYNQDESGRMVWDGADEHIASQLNPVNVRFATPGSSAELYELQSEGIFSWIPWPDDIRGRKPAGVLDRCTASKSCPKIFETFGGTELWDLRYTANLVGTSADKDIPLPDNVRRYYFPSTPHGGGNGGFTVDGKPPANCTLDANPNPEGEEMRALMAALIDWVVKVTPPPPSRYPTLAKGELAPPEEVGKEFPKIPGVPSPAGIENHLLDYDLGPHFNYNDEAGVITQEPPVIKHVLPVVVPKVNGDGNEMAGIPSVLLQAPLGTYTGWNFEARGFFKGQACGYTGGYIPFAKTKAERMASGDPRPSIEERYASQDAYVAQVKAAAAKLVSEHFMLQEDANRVIQQAEASNIFAGK